MKKIEAIFQSGKFDKVKEGLFKAGISGITVTDVTGYGFQKSKMNMLKGQDVSVELVPRVKLETVVKDNEAGKAMDIIINITRTGRIGDGKIFVTDISDAVRIRTGEKGEDAV